MSGNKRPNILLFFTDQQRADTIHALGNPTIQTPNLDRLCREGTAFTRAFTPSPVCVPGRCSMYHGLYPFHTRCYDNGFARQDDPPSVMKTLADSGYRTHGVGKAHFDRPEDQLNGFQSRDIQEEGNPNDEYRTWLREQGYEHAFDAHGQRGEMYYIPQLSQLPAKDHPSQWVADRSIDFLKNRDRNQPFFLFSSFIHPHPPFSPPTPWNKIYRTSEMPHAFVPEHYEECLTYSNRMQNRYKYRDQGIDRNLVRTQKAFYYACISFVDYQIGRILAQLEAAGELDNTLVVLASDHGEMLGDYHSFGKRSMLNPAVQVPMIARFPSEFKAHSRVSAPVSLVDLMPTFLQVAGIDQSELRLDGESLLDIAERKSDRRYVYSQYQTAGKGLYMIASDTRKYIYSAPDDLELYFNSELDPTESRNLAGLASESGHLAEMKRELIRTLLQSGEDAALDGDNWRQYPRLELPADPDGGLIYQDEAAQRDRESALPSGYRIRFPEVKQNLL